MPETELTDGQILEQCKMYIAALRIADEFGCDAIGIQYQQGLKDLAPASDLVEGLLNNVDRPPVTSASNGRVLFEGEALPHFNEVDECAGLDAPGHQPRLDARSASIPRPRCTMSARARTTERTEFVWVFEISGAAPPAHFIGGYAGAVSERQPPMYFRLGGGTLKGISKPGEIVWSRVFVEDGELKADLGLRQVDRAAAGRNRAPLADHHAAMADHARRTSRRHARPDDGAAQVQSHPGRLRAGLRER